MEGEVPTNQGGVAPRQAPQPNQGNYTMDLGSDDDSAGEGDDAKGGATRPRAADT